MMSQRTFTVLFIFSPYTGDRKFNYYLSIRKEMMT